jgi:hypothetical protein
MPIFSPNVVNATKKAADTLAFTTLAVKEMLQLFNPQNKNLFEMTLAPQDFSFSSLGWAALDTSMATMYVQSIDMNFFGVEYERYNHEQAASGISYPEDVTLHLIDNEEAFVRAYVQKWMAATVAIREFSGVPGDYVFADKQYDARKQALIIPQMTTGLPSPCWVKITGMRFKSCEPWSFSQSDNEPLVISIVCAVDNVQLFSPLTAVL